MRFKARYQTVCITFIVLLQICQGGDPEEEHPQDLLSHDNPQNVIADENLPPEFATLPSSDSPDELNNANKPKKTTTCVTDDRVPSDYVVTPSDSGDFPTLKNKTKTNSLDPYGLDNFGDPPLDIPTKKKKVTTKESDGNNDESYLTPANSEDAPLPKNKSKTASPDLYGLDNFGDPPLDIPAKKKNVTTTELDGSNDESYLNPANSGDAPLPKKKSKTTSPDSYGLDNFAEPPVDIPAKKKNVSTTESNGSNDESFLTPVDSIDAPLPKKKSKTTTPVPFVMENTADTLVDIPPKKTKNTSSDDSELANYLNELKKPKPAQKGYPSSNGELDVQFRSLGGDAPAEHENIRNEIVLTPKNQLSGSPNNGVNKTDINGSAYGPTKMPTDPSGVTSSGISHQKIPPNGPLAFENNRVNSFDSNGPKSPQIGSPADGLNQNVKSPQQISPRGAHESGALGNNPNEINAYGNAFSPFPPQNSQVVNSLGDGMNTYGKAPQQISPDGPGTLANNGVVNVPKSPQVGSPVDGFNTYEKSPQQLIPKGSQQPGALGNNLSEINAHNPNSPKNPQDVKSPFDGPKGSPQSGLLGNYLDETNGYNSIPTKNSFGKSPQQISPKSAMQTGTLGNDLDEIYANSPNSPKNPQIVNHPIDGFNQYEKVPQQISPKGAQQAGTLGSNFDATNTFSNANIPNSPKNTSDGFNQNRNSPKQISPKSPQQPGHLGNNLEENNAYNPNAFKNLQVVGSPVDDTYVKSNQQISPKSAMQPGTLGNNINDNNTYNPNASKNPGSSPVVSLNTYEKLPQQISPKTVPQPGTLGNNVDETNSYGNAYDPNAPKNPPVVLGSPIVESPVVGSPIVGSPVVGSPVVGSPVVGSPVVGSPVVGSPIVGYPVVGSPVEGSPIAGSPVVGSPIAVSPVDNLNINGQATKQISPKSGQQPGSLGKNPVGSPVVSLNSFEKLPQEISPKTVPQPGTLGNNVDKSNSYGNAYDLNAPKNPPVVLGSPVVGSPVVGSPVVGSPVVGSPVVGSPVVGSPVVGSPIVGSPVVGSPFAVPPVDNLNINGQATKQISPNSGQQPGSLGKNPVGSPVVSLNSFEKLPQEISPKTVPQPGTLGNNVDKTNSYGNAYDPNAPKNPPVVLGSPVVGSPVVGSPVIGSTVVGSPVVGSPVVGSPIVGSPVVGSPVVGSPVVGSPEGVQQSGSLDKHFDESIVYGNANNTSLPKNLLGAPVEGLNTYEKTTQKVPLNGGQQAGTLGNNLDRTNSNGLDSPSNPHIGGSPVDGLNQYGKQAQQISPKTAQQPAGPGTIGNGPDNNMKKHDNTHYYGSNSPNNPISDLSLDGVNTYGSPQQMSPKGAPGYAASNTSGTNNEASSPYGGVGTLSKGTQSTGSTGGKNSNGTNANGPLTKPKNGLLQTTTVIPFDDEIPPGPIVVPVGLEMKPAEMEKLCALPPLPKGENICFQRRNQKNEKNVKNWNTLDTWMKICETIATNMGYCQGVCLYIESPIDTGIYYSVCGISKSNTSDTSDTSNFVYLTTQDIPIVLPPGQTCPNNRYKVLHETVSAPRK